MRFGAVALSVDWVASDAILRLRALYIHIDGNLVVVGQEGDEK